MSATVGGRETYKARANNYEIKIEPETNPDTMSGNMLSRKHKIIIKFGTRNEAVDLDVELGRQEKLTEHLATFIWRKWGLSDEDYYLNISGTIHAKTDENFPNGCDIFADIQPRIRGGNPIKAIFKAILNGILSIFKPIIKPLAAIANAFLMLVKGVLYIIMLLIWFLKFCAWFFTEVLPSIPSDIFGMVRFIAAMLIDAVVGTIGYYFKKLFNSAGSTVVGAALTGWDNNPDADDTPRTKSNTKSQPSDDKFADSEKNNDTGNQPSCEGRKCYMTEAGTVPWTVILATVLFPPAGVFMELGLHGWLQILVCLLLTFMFYFPGLIYALILLYC